MSRAEAPEHIQDLASTMKSVETAQAERLQKGAEGIFGEAVFLKKMEKRRQEFGAFLKNAKLTKEKERAFLQSPEVKALVQAMDQMKRLKEKRENLVLMGRSIEQNLLTLFDRFTKVPEKKIVPLSKEEELRKKAQSLLGETAGLLPKEKISVSSKEIAALYKHILEHQKTAKAALDTWNNRQMVPKERGLSAGETLQESEAVQLKEAYGILRTLRPSRQLYEGMKYMQREYPKIWLQQSLLGEGKRMKDLLNLSPLNEQAITTTAQRLHLLSQELRAYEKNPKKLPPSYLKIFPEVRNRLYSDDLSALKDTMKNIPKGVLLGVKETVVSTASVAWKLGKDMVLFPSLVGYATAHYQGDVQAVLKEMAADNVYGKMLKGFVDVGRLLVTDPKKAERTLFSLLKTMPDHLGTWWDALTPEEKGEAIGKMLSNLLPMGAALKYVPKASALVRESAVLKKVGEVLHTSILLKHPPEKWNGKAFLDLLKPGALKIVGPGYIEKQVYAKLKSQFPKDYTKFFEQKTGMLNGEFVSSKEGRKILEDAGFRFAGMVDVGGVGTENAIFGSHMTDKRFAYIKQIASEAEKRGMLPCRVGGDEFLFFSHDEKIFKNIQGKMNQYQKGLDKKKVDISHKAEGYKSTAKKELALLEKKAAKKVSSELLEKDYVGAQKKIFEEMAHVMAKDPVSDVASFQKAFPKKKFTTEELDQIRQLQSLAKRNGEDVAKELHVVGEERLKFGKIFEDLAVYIFLKQKAAKAPKSNFGVMYTVYDKLEIKELDTLLARLEDGISLRKKAEGSGKKTYVKLSPSKLEQFLGKAKNTWTKEKNPSSSSPDFTDTGSLKDPDVKHVVEVARKKIENTTYLKFHDRTDLAKSLGSLVPKDVSYVAAIGWESNVGAYNNLTKFAASGSGTSIANELIALSREVTKKAADELEKHGAKLELHIINEGGTFALYVIPKKGSPVSSQDAQKILTAISAQANKAQQEFLKDRTLKEGKRASQAAVDKVGTALAKTFAKMSVGQYAPLTIDAFQQVTKARVLSPTSASSLKQLLF